MAVAEERSFARAQRLRRTQPAVSQMAKLELELGKPLFDRSLKDGSLTDAGRCSSSTPSRATWNLRRDATNALQELGDLRRGEGGAPAPTTAPSTSCPSCRASARATPR